MLTLLLEWTHLIKQNLSLYLHSIFYIFLHKRLMSFTLFREAQLSI